MNGRRYDGGFTHKHAHTHSPSRSLSRFPFSFCFLYSFSCLYFLFLKIFLFSFSLCYDVWCTPSRPFFLFPSQLHSFYLPFSLSPFLFFFSLFFSVSQIRFKKKEGRVILRLQIRKQTRCCPRPAHGGDHGTRGWTDKDKE